jgi:hypothetical protein
MPRVRIERAAGGERLGLGETALGALRLPFRLGFDGDREGGTDLFVDRHLDRIQRVPRKRALRGIRNAAGGKHESEHEREHGHRTYDEGE